MISDQLKKIKREQKSILGKSNIHISFSKLDDIENETLLELIPISTKYTSRQSLYFDRFRLSIDQEVKFNTNFSKFLMDLVQYVQTPDIEYLYDFLIRKYYVHKFNPKEIIFVLLLHTNYYNQLISIDKYAGLQWFECQKDYSTHFIAELCIRDKDFFSLYLNYYQYFHLEFIKFFVDEITQLILQKLGPDVLKFVSFFYEIISLLVDNNHKNEAVKLYIRIKPFLGNDTKEFDTIIGEIHNAVSSENVKYDCPVTLHNIEIFEEFKCTQNSNNGRKYVENIDMLKKYADYLFKNNFKDNSLSDAEISLLNDVSDSFVSQYRIEKYKDLLKESPDQSFVVEKLLKYSIEEFSKIIGAIRSVHCDIVVGKYPTTFKYFINKENCKEIEVIVRKDSKLFIEFLDYCLENNFLEIRYFECQITIDEVIEKLKECLDHKNRIYSLLQISSNRDFKISNFLIENELYKLPFVLNYIAKDIKHGYDISTNHDIYSIFFDLIEDSNISSLIIICDTIKNKKFTNKLVDYVIKNSAYSEQFVEFVENNLNEITTENVKLFLESYGYQMKLFRIIEFVTVINDKIKNNIKNEQAVDKRKCWIVDYNLIDRMYKYKAFDVLYELAIKYGFATIIENLDVKNKEKLLEMFYYEGMVKNEDMLNFLLYISNIMNRNDKIYLKILCNEYKHLIYLNQSLNWNLIKLILIEGMQKNVSQEMFEVFVDNLPLYENDLDLLSSICKFRIIDKNSTLKNKIYYSLKNTPNANVADIIINNTEYLDIRIVPFITPKLIEHKKPSIYKLFYEFKNIMSPYVGLILEKFPESYKSLFNLEAKVLIKKVIEICRQKKTIGDLSNTIISQVLQKEVLPELTYQDLNVLFIEYVNEVSSSCFYWLLTKYKTVDILPLVNLLFDLRYEDFIGVAHLSVKNMSIYYSKYVQLSLEKEELTSKEYKFVSAYLKYLPRDKNISEIVSKFDSFLDHYLQDGDMNLAKLIAQSLNFIKDKSCYTKKILHYLKEPHTVLILKLFQSIIRNTDNYKKQIKLISPHLSLLIDSTRSNIASECQNLLTVIDKVYGFNPLIS